MTVARCPSFDDLFRAVHGRGFTSAEAEAFARLTQGAKNQAVKGLVAKTSGAFVCEDCLGSDGVTYTAFRAATACKTDANTIKPGRDDCSVA